MMRRQRSSLSRLWSLYCTGGKETKRDDYSLTLALTCKYGKVISITTAAVERRQSGRKSLVRSRDRDWTAGLDGDGDERRWRWRGAGPIGGAEGGSTLLGKVLIILQYCLLLVYCCYCT